MVSTKFPLWHGKVATQWKATQPQNNPMCFRFGMVKLQLEPNVTAFKQVNRFPLWHGKVATKMWAGASVLTDMFPLWHGKVAT